MAQCDKCGTIVEQAATACLCSKCRTEHRDMCDRAGNAEFRAGDAERHRDEAQEHARVARLERDEMKQDLADLKKKWKQALRERDAAFWCMSKDLIVGRCGGCPAENDQELCKKLPVLVLNRRVEGEAREAAHAARHEQDDTRVHVVELEVKLLDMSELLQREARRTAVGLVERDAARRFGEEATKKYNALLKDADAVTCAFCGHEYPRGTPRHSDGHLIEHIKTCPKHPMREVEEKLCGLEHAYGELKTRNTILETKVAENEKQLSYDAFLRDELRTQLDEKERVDKASSAANKRLRDESDSLRNRVSACAGRISALISLVNRLLVKMPRVRITDNSAGLCTGCGVVFYRYGSITMAEQCKPDCLFTVAQRVLADCNSALPT